MAGEIAKAGYVHRAHLLDQHPRWVAVDIDLWTKRRRASGP